MFDSLFRPLRGSEEGSRRSRYRAKLLKSTKLQQRREDAAGTLNRPITGIHAKAKQLFGKTDDWQLQLPFQFSKAARTLLIPFFLIFASSLVWHLPIGQGVAARKQPAATQTGTLQVVNDRIWIPYQRVTAPIEQQPQGNQRPAAVAEQTKKKNPDAQAEPEKPFKPSMPGVEQSEHWLDWFSHRNPILLALRGKVPCGLQWMFKNPVMVVVGMLAAWLIYAWLRIFYLLKLYRLVSKARVSRCVVVDTEEKKNRELLSVDTQVLAVRTVLLSGHDKELLLMTQKLLEARAGIDVSICRSCGDEVSQVDVSKWLFIEDEEELKQEPERLKEKRSQTVPDNQISTAVPNEWVQLLEKKRKQSQRDFDELIMPPKWEAPPKLSEMEVEGYHWDRIVEITARPFEHGDKTIVWRLWDDQLMRETTLRAATLGEKVDKLVNELTKGAP